MSYRGNNRGRGRGGGRGGGRFGGPKLPSTLMDEVNASYGSSSRSTGPRARKEMRKAARQGPPPRQNPQQASSSRHARDEEEDDDGRAPPPSAKAKGKRRAEPEPEVEERVAKKPKSKSKAQPEVEDDGARKGKKKKLPELTLPTATGGDAEDVEIEWLEYMLHKEKKGEDDLDDDLDDLLDFTEKLEEGELGRGDVTDSEVDSNEEEGHFGDFDDLDLDSEEEEGEWGGIVSRDDSVGDEDEAEEDEEDEDKDEDEDDAESEDAYHDSDSTSSPPAETSNDAEASTDTPAPGRYVPPHMRAAMLAEKAAGDSAKSLERIKLERKAQGLLNKLSEANTEGILAEVEKLFGDYSRNDVTTTITQLVIQMIGMKANLLDSFVVLYATLIGALHRVVGIEFGAHFVQTLVKKYTELAAGNAPTAIQAADDVHDASKEAFNLLTLIAELYNAGVIGAGLIYDLVRGFIGEDGDATMAERSVEGLMKILKCCGSQLRADDPASLKDIVTLVQERTRGKEADMTVRAKFMIETLVALRSGKTKGLGAEREDVARMRRFLSGLGKKRRLLAPEPLRVGLADLQNADTRGKWWLVGAGWSGNPLIEKATSLSFDKDKKAVKKTPAEKEDEEVLLELARKQGMNTDVRRSVFVVLLTSEDYVHACDRLNAFHLTQVQQREFVRVALHCCGMEKTYNPYYTLVLNELCAGSYDHRFTLQYAVWDLMRELGEGAVSDSRAANVGRALAFLIARGSVDVTILKAVDFTDLSKASRKFLDALLRSLLIATQSVSPLLALPKGFDPAKNWDEEAVEEVFDRALSNAELSGGLVYMLQAVRKAPGKGVGEREGEVVRLGAEVAVSVLGKAI